jgi:hypothetical protein
MLVKYHSPDSLRTGAPSRVRRGERGRERVDDRVLPTAERPPFWTRTRTAVAAGALALAVVLAVGGGLVWRSQQTSPAETVTTIASAAMKGDADSVAASIDTTSLVDSAVDDVFSSAEQTSALVSDYLKKHPGATKAKARATVDEEIREHVQSGTLPKRIPIGSDSLKALVAGALARKSVRSVKVDGNIAHVVVTVPYKGKRLTVKVRMRRSGSTWKVDRIENMASVLKQAGY